MGKGSNASELSEEGLGDSLSWRSDPKASLSDYRIRIYVKGGDSKSKTYYVHKTMLAFGSKKSAYYARLFQSKSSGGQEPINKSNIELEKPAADAFPYLLDYIYSPHDDDLDIDHENAVALHRLAVYFEVALLRRKSLTFCNDNMTIDQCGIYWEQARLVNDKVIQRLAVQKFLENMTAYSSCEFGTASQLLQTSDERFWLDVLKENKGKPTRHLATFIGVVCFERMSQIDPEMFLQLTDETLLPEMSFVAAQQLLFVESVLLPEANRSRELTNLQERCVKALASSWKVVVELGLLLPPNANPRICSSLLVCSLEQAKNTVDTLAKKVSRAERVIPNAIAVSGAGRESLNGLYVRDVAYRNGAPVYVKEVYDENGEVIGHDDIFLDEFDWWRISDAYSIPHLVDQILLPPRSRGGWAAVSSAVSPVPLLSYRFDNPVDDNVSNDDEKKDDRL